MIAVKVTDDIPVAGAITDIIAFARDISNRYKVQKITIDNDIQFNGCEISQDVNGNIRMDMSSFFHNVKPITLHKYRRIRAHEKATKREIGEFRSLAGALLSL